jgi:riboflavin synthase
MFTGIIQGIATVEKFEKKPGLLRLLFNTPKGFTKDIKHGASVAIDGCCLTVVGQDGDRLSFDIMGETITKTTIGKLKKGSRVNVERSFHAGDEIGGHIVSGHVTGKAKIVNIENPENNHVITFEIPKTQMKYIFPKGFIALNGASLTIADVDKSKGVFTVWLIPETLKLTTFGLKEIGDEVNFEIDSSTHTIVDTVERVLEEKGMVK